MILIDADAFIALNHKLDVHHKNALLLFRSISESGEVLVTTWDVMDEVSSKLSQFLTKDVALSFLDNVFGSNIRVEYVYPLLATKAIELFKKQTSKRVSMTDCVNMVIAKELGVKKIFSFDQHYVKNHFELLK